MSHDSLVVFGDPGMEATRVGVGERLIAGNPEHAVRNHFSHESGQINSGIWDSNAGKWNGNPAHTEVSHILEGSVRLTYGDGQTREFKAGDMFVVPQGVATIWEVDNLARKLYVTIRLD